MSHFPLLPSITEHRVNVFSVYIVNSVLIHLFVDMGSYQTRVVFVQFDWCPLDFAICPAIQRRFFWLLNLYGETVLEMSLYNSQARRNTR